MIRLFSLFTCLVLTTYFANAGPVPFIKKCRADDSKCGKESAQAAIPIYTVGVPEFDVQPLDPLHIDSVDASTAGLKLIVSDVTVRGLKGCEVKKLQRDKAKSKLIVKVQCDVTLEGQYEMNGRLLILPMEGKGPLHVKLRKILISADIDMEEKTGKDGKKHWNIKQFTHGYELKDKADVVFENLFSGSEVLGRAARDLVASSGNDIIDEVGPPVLKAVLVKIVKNVNRFFHTVPAEELSVD